MGDKWTPTYLIERGTLTNALVCMGTLYNARVWKGGPLKTQFSLSQSFDTNSMIRSEVASNSFLTKSSFVRPSDLARYEIYFCIRR